MKKTSRPTRKQTPTGWRHAGPNRHAAYLADKRWRVQLDPDLVELLSGSGSVAAHLLGFAERRQSQRERLVAVIPMTDEQYAALRPILTRLGAKVRRVPPHPNAGRDAAKPRRRAG